MTKAPPTKLQKEAKKHCNNNSSKNCPTDYEKMRQDTELARDMLASYDRFDDTRFMINEVNDFMKTEEKKKTKFNNI